MVYIFRDIEKELIKFIKSPEIIAVVGARQVGKTTLITNIVNKFNKKKVKVITFDNIDILNLFVNNIESFIKLYIKDVDILFIDELHYAKDSGRSLKYIYDTNKHIKIIISGSSAIELSIQSLRYLVGRVVSFELYSFSFSEYLRSKDSKLYDLYLSSNYKETILKILNRYFEEYLLFGGYPRIVLEKDINSKKKLLSNIYNTYVLRDIKELENIKDDFKLYTLIKALSIQIGNLINYSELSVISGYNYVQLKSVLNIFEKTYVCKFISPFYTNKRTELVKSKMIYFLDLGIRNSIINNFSLDRSDLGALKENFVLIELLKKNYDVRYWRTKHGAEVDFIIEINNKIIPIEVKSNLKNENLTNSLISFITKYKPEKAYVVSNSFESQRKINNTNVIFIPFVKFTTLLLEL
jgi:predicted AAA+ superfamily ATPase